MAASDGLGPRQLGDLLEGVGLEAKLEALGKAVAQDAAGKAGGDAVRSEEGARAPVSGPAARAAQIQARNQGRVAKTPSEPPEPPEDDLQQELFASFIADVAGKDVRGTMDVALFRLSKRDTRASAVIRYELPDGVVEVSSGAHGMATAWDFDIVLLAISQLTEATNRWRAGKGPKPSQTIRPHASEVLSFCRRKPGGDQYQWIREALKRLNTTNVSVDRKTKRGKLQMEAEPLLTRVGVVSGESTDRIGALEFDVPKWIYKEIVESEKPGVLTVHEDYFLIQSGIARFLYRLFRRAAGRTSASWSFALLFERSGSTGTQKEFNRTLRSLIKDNDLPEYTLSEVTGKDGPILVATYRGAKPPELLPGG